MAGIESSPSTDGEPRLQGVWRSRRAQLEQKTADAAAAKGEQPPPDMSLPLAAERSMLETPKKLRASCVEDEDGAGSVSEQSTMADDSSQAGSFSPQLTGDDLSDQASLPKSDSSDTLLAEEPLEVSTEEEQSLKQSDDSVAVEAPASQRAVKDEPKADSATAPRAHKDVPAAESIQVLLDVKPHSPEARGSPAMVSVLAQVQALSKECFDGDDCLDGCSKRGGWRLTLLVSGMEQGADAVLLGFIVYRIKAELKVFSVAKLAVPQEFRRHGYGKQLILWAVQYAKKNPDIDVVALSSLAQAVTFYQRLGFKRLHEIVAKDPDDDSFLPGQVYMELVTRKGRPAGGRGRR